MNTEPKYDTCFFERYARETLIDLVSCRYAGLVNRDRPDLQDDYQSIGIEVTRAMRESKKSAGRMVNNVAGNQVLKSVSISNPANNIENEDIFADYGFVLNGQANGKAEKLYWLKALPLQKIILNKIEKVIDGFYGDFEEFGLYVFSLEHLAQSDIIETVDWIIDIQEGRKHHYNYLYVSQCDELWVCNLTLREVVRHTIPLEKRRRYYQQALLKQKEQPFSEYKQRLRTIIRTRKSVYSMGQLSSWSEEACLLLEKSPEWNEAKTILLYCNLPDEVQTKGLIRRAISSGKKIVLPVVSNQDLELRAYQGEGTLQEGAYHILEPQGEEYKGSVDLAVVPGMAFDKDGHRLGRGKGFYDRLFHRISCPKIGLCFHFQVLENIPVEPHDIRMDSVISNPFLLS